jgi:DNA-binding beta-propeller fold protein YncE
MSASVRKALQIVAGVLAVLVAIAGVVLIWLIYPGKPSTGRHLEFKGYVLLPQAATLTVLDYLTIDGTRLFVTDESTGSVYRISLHDGAVPSESDVSVFESLPASHGVVIDPTSKLAFVSRSELNTVDIFDPDTLKLIKQIHVADDPDGIFYDPLDKVVYVASGDAMAATVIDPVTRNTVATIPLGGKAEFAAWDASAKLLYQNLEDTNTLAAVDLSKRAVVQRWPLTGCSGPSGMALDEPGRRLFVVCSQNATLAIFDLNTHEVTKTFPIGSHPDSVAYDPQLRRLYTTGKSGVLVTYQQDSPDTYRQIDSISLHYGAHTLTVDPATHWVYVGYAGLVARARVAVFRPLP